MPQNVSYATSWECYIDGNIISASNLRFIKNLLAATAVNKAADSDDSSDDSDAEAWRNWDASVGNMDLVNQTLQGSTFRMLMHGLLQ